MTTRTMFITRAALTVAALLAACGGDDDGGDVACFAVGTRVSTPGGTRAIEDLRPGHLVLSFERATGRILPAFVTEVRRHRSRPFRVLELPGGARLGVTDDHPIFERGQDAYVPVRRLSSDSLLVALKKDGAAAEDRRGITFMAGDRGDVYDLSVTGEHNYFAEGVLVHNKTPDASPPADAEVVCDPVVMACMDWAGPSGGIHGYLFDGCDTPGCCMKPSTWWAAGLFSELPPPGETATPIDVARADPRGAYELAASEAARVLCAGEPLEGGDLRVIGSCIDLVPGSAIRLDYVSGPGGGVLLDCD